jgi:hypothetical protein
MTPAIIIREAQADGVRLALSPAGTIKATGDGAAVSRWLSVIRERKAEIIEALKVGAAETATDSRCSIGQAPASLTASEEMAIRAWLALIGETDPETIAEVIGQCRQIADVRNYFIGRAAAELPKPDLFPDDRRICEQCANLIARCCQAAKRGEIVASRNYEPIRDLPRRCEGYAPGADDPDRRHGRERWPGLTDTKGTK